MALLQKTGHCFSCHLWFGRCFWLKIHCTTHLETWIFKPFQNKNKFVYSVWIARISLGMALSILWGFEDDKDGRGVYFKVKDIYECVSNMKQVALMSMTKLSALTLTYNTTGGVPVFITKFRTILNDLKDAKESVSVVMAKSMLLSKIQGKDLHTHSRMVFWAQMTT